MQRVRMHTYWSQRVLERVPTLAPSAPAAAHHERLDGSGYHRGDFGIRISPTARLLAAAGVYAAPTEPRPHRNACTVDEAVGQLTCGSGLQHPGPCRVRPRTPGRGRTRPRRQAGLTAREIEVLRQAADGLTSHQAGAELSCQAAPWAIASGTSARRRSGGSGPGWPSSPCSSHRVDGNEIFVRPTAGHV
ncbi:hypothetical protein E0500_019805 [Streptomyces sp. KM273126]|nr:hypothetical protein [Streptomyces sp. KM273126]